jgi:hypothetical protein
MILTRRTLWTDDTLIKELHTVIIKALHQVEITFICIIGP